MRFSSQKDVLFFAGIFALIVGAGVWTWLFRQPLGLPQVWYVVGMVVLGLGLLALIGGVIYSQLRGRPSPYKRRRAR